MKRFLAYMLAAVMCLGVHSLVAEEGAADADEISEDAEAGWEKDVTQQDLERPHMLDAVAEKKELEQEKLEKALKMYEAHGGMQQSAGKEDAGEAAADRVRERGGEDAQRISSQSSKEISSADADDSLGQHLWDALEYSVSTGFHEFGESFGKGAGDEIFDRPRGGHHDDGD